MDKNNSSKSSNSNNSSTSPSSSSSSSSSYLNPPIEKKRAGPKFNIKDLIEIKSDQQEGSGAKTNTQNSELIKEICGYTKISEKFKLARHVSEFNIEPLKNLDTDPFEQLEVYVNQSVEKVVQEGKNKFGNIDQIALSISSDQLDYDIFQPFSQMTKNTIESFLNRFEIVQVRFATNMFLTDKWVFKASKDSENRSIFDAPFVLKICVLNSEDHPRRNLNPRRYRKK